MTFCSSLFTHSESGAKLNIGPIFGVPNGTIINLMA